MPDIEAAAGDGEVNVRMLVKLATISVQGTEDTDLYALLAVSPEHCRVAARNRGQLLLKNCLWVKPRPESQKLPGKVGRLI